MSGILSVNNYEEFLVLVDQIKNSYVDTFTKFEQPSIIALVGPSGSNKKLLAKMLAAKTNSAIVKSGDTDGSDEQIVSTYYAGRKYSLSKAEIDENLGNDRNVIVAVDMCGAMALKRSYPVTLVFCKAHRENMILDILSRENMSIVEKKNRLLSMEQELKNEKLCDLTVRTDCLDEESIEKILEQIFR